MAETPNKIKLEVEVSGNPVIKEILAARQTRIDGGYGPTHDDEFGVERLSIEVSRTATFHVAHTTDEQARKRFIEAAVLAVAAVEAIDRRAEFPLPDGQTRVDLNDLAARNRAR